MLTRVSALHRPWWLWFCRYCGYLHERLARSCHDMEGLSRRLFSGSQASTPEQESTERKKLRQYHELMKVS